MFFVRLILGKPLQCLAIILEAPIIKTVRSIAKSTLPHPSTDTHANNYKQRPDFARQALPE